MSRASTQASSPQPGLTREQRARALGQCPTREHCVLRAENVVKSFHRGVWPRRGTVQVLNRWHPWLRWHPSGRSDQLLLWLQ